jgi:hypothetical protein
MNERGSRYHRPASQDDDPWRHHRSQSQPMTTIAPADNPYDFDFAGGNGRAMDHRHYRSSDWDSRDISYDGHSYSQQIRSSDYAYAAAAAAHTREIDNNYFHRHGQFPSIERVAHTPINRDNANHRNDNVIRTKIGRATKHRAKHDLPGPAGAWFRQQKQKRATKRQQNHDVTNKNMKMAIVSLSNKSTVLNNENSKEIDTTITAQPLACTSHSAQNIDNEVRGRREEQIIRQPLRILTIDREDDADSPSVSSPNNGGDGYHSKRQQQQSLFHDHSSDLHECNAWNVMCKTLDRVVPPLHHVLSSFSFSCSSSCREMKKCDREPTDTSSSAYSSVATYYKNILRTNIPHDYALICEVHEGKYDVCHCFKSALHAEGGAVLHTDDLRIPLLVGYVASVQCHAHSDWTALLVDEMYSVGTNGKGGGGFRNSSSANTTRGIVCWIEERLVKQYPNYIRPGAVWMLEGAKLALFTSACEEEDDDNSDDNNNDICGNGNTNNITGSDTSPSTDNARRRAGVNSIDRMILAGESSLVYAWTPEEVFTDADFVVLTEKRFNLGLPHEVEERLIGMVEKGQCRDANDDLRNNRTVEIKAVGISLGQSGHMNTLQPAELVNDHSSHANKTVDVRSHKETNSESSGDELFVLMQVSRKDVAQCEVQGKGIDLNEDDHGSLKIAQAKQPLLLPSPSATTAEEITLLPRPTIHGKARPVTSESISSMPPDHDDISPVHPVGKDTDPKNSNDEARHPEFKLNNFVNDGKMDTTSCMSIEIAQTPIAKHGTNLQREIYTGNDSFDDMLDEAVTPCGTNHCRDHPSLPVQKTTDTPSQSPFANKMNTHINYVASNAPGDCGATLLFDSLDGDDLDCLSEEDD